MVRRRMGYLSLAEQTRCIQCTFARSPCSHYINSPMGSPYMFYVIPQCRAETFLSFGQSRPYTWFEASVPLGIKTVQLATDLTWPFECRPSIKERASIALALRIARAKASSSR